jgi:hypothetical protein
MADGFFKIKKGLNLGSATADPSNPAEGDFYLNTTDNVLRAYVQGAWRTATFNDQTATLTNKTISGVDNDINDVDSGNVNVTPTGNLASSNVGDALNELQGDIDTITDAAAADATNLADHLADTTDAHDASAISFVSAGTIAATNVQSAIEEVATEAASDLTTHEADTSTHGVGVIVGTTETQTLSGKTFAQAILPDANNTRDLGASGTKFKDLYLSGNATIGGNTTITGTLQVDGTTVTVNSTNLAVADKNITINNGGNDASSEGAGITVDRSPGTDGSIIYKDASATKFAAGLTGSEVDLVGTSSTQTLTNKTLTTPVISSISNTGTLTLPTSTDTLIGRATTDTLTNKTLTSPTINTPTTDIILWDDQAGVPANPASGFYKTYFKTDGKMYKLDSTGTETEIGSGAAGGTFTPESADTAYAFSNGTGTPVNCALSTVSGKTRITLTWTYTTGVNSGETSGHIQVYLNGQRVPRFVNSTLTPDASYTEVSTTVIDLDTDYSSYPYSIEVVKTLVLANTAGDIASSKNYFGNSNAENGTTGWTTYADGGAAPVDLTGGSPTATFTQSSSNPLRGTYNFLFTAGALGNGVAYTITPDRADIKRGSVLSLSAEIEASGTIATGDYIWAIYDVNNAALIQPAGYQIPGSVAGIAFRATASFQLPTNGTTFRIGIHQAVASPGGNLKIDSITCSPQSLVYGAPVTDWQSYTMTITGSSSNPTKASSPAKDQAYWRRNGSNMEIRYDYGHTSSAGAAAGSGDYRFSLPSGYTIDSSVPLNNAFQGYLGTGVVGTGVSTSTFQGLLFAENNTSFSFLGANETTANAILSNTQLAALNNTSVYYSFRASIPIQGWSSSVVMSDSADTRVVAFNASTPSGSLGAAYNQITWTKLNDTHGAWNTNVYTVPIPGWYQINATISVSGTFSAGNNGELLLRVNGVDRADHDCRAGGAQTWLTPNLSTLQYLNAGDLLTFFGFFDGTGLSYVASATYQRLSIYRLSGPAAIAATETVSARYKYGGSSNIPATASFIDFTTKDWDSHGAVSNIGAGYTSSGTTSWRFTAPVSGLYRVNVKMLSAAAVSTAGGFDLQLYKNGAFVNTIFYGIKETSNTTRLAWQGNSEVKLLAGDYIGVVISTTQLVATHNDDAHNWVEITRVGNY